MHHHPHLFIWPYFEFHLFRFLNLHNANFLLFRLWLIRGRMDIPTYSVSLVWIYLQFSRGPKTHSNFLFFEYFLQLSNDLNSLCIVRFIHRCFIVGLFPNYILIMVKLLQKREFYQEALRQIYNPGFRISLGIVYK